MGSYISIVNDTPDPWQRKIGPDMLALKIAGIVVASVGAIAATIMTAGGAAPLLAALTANGVVSVFGVSTSALAAVTASAASVSTAAAVIGGVSGFSMGVAEGLAQQFNKDGYTAIAPGGSYRSGKKTLSLWQQGTCVKTVIVDETKVRVETLYMRPIFTGATANSNRNYMIKAWLEKKGTNNQEIVAKTGEARSMDDDELLRDPNTQIVYFYDNGTNSYHD